MRAPLVHVLVTNWNGREHLAGCFDSLLSSAYENVQFVLLDNASTDGSVEFVQERFGDDRRVEIVPFDTNLGWSGANNAGMRRAMDAGAAYVFLLNNDTATNPDAIPLLVRFAEENPEVAALAPRMMLYDEDGIVNSLGIACSLIGAGWDIGIGRSDQVLSLSSEPVLAACGGAAFYRCSALRDVGLLAEDFEIYLDDLDLGLRMWNAGYEVRSCPDSVIRHKFSATMEGSDQQARRKYYLNTRNRFRLMLRCFPASKAGAVALRTLQGEANAIGRALLDGEYWRVVCHLRAWLDALRYFPKARAFRREHGQPCRFWRMIRTDELFFHGTEFPVHGWYEKRPIRGEDLHPMATVATLDSPGGRLRVTHANCYPHLGSTCIEVQHRGETVVVLETNGVDETAFEAPAGRLLFVSRHMFSADDTGATFDAGGWLACRWE